MRELEHYSYRGARACVLLHERHIRDCLGVWRQAKAANIKLPVTSDEDYESMEAVLRHILRAARGYMIWICKQLDLPDPEIRETPSLDIIEAEAENYLEHLLERWRLPLANIEERYFDHPVYPSNWGVSYCIDAMLEHAVMHPIRHAFQLQELIASST